MKPSKAADLTELVDIKIDPQEIVERVEELLAWEAIASEGSGIRYDWQEFLRADPYIRLGTHAYGRLAPASMEACDMSEYYALPRDERVEANMTDNLWLRQHFTPQLDLALSKLGDRLSYASIVECAPDATVDAHLHTSGWGDNVDDSKNDGGWLGVQYLLKATFEAPRKLRDWYRTRYRLPQTAKIFNVQHVAAFRDGRASSGMLTIGYWAGQFHDLATKRPYQQIVNLIGLRAGDVYDYATDLISEAWEAQISRRQEWTVELALGPKRTGIGLATDATGALEFINAIRGKDTKAGRRKTLVHWVSEHMRQRRGATQPHLVRAHLRGRQTLEAGPFAARIWPSREDIERACNGTRFEDARRREVEAST